MQTIDINPADARDLQTESSLAAPRLDLYAGIHKAMRAMMADALVALGAADALDEDSIEAALAKLERLIELAAGHLEHENRFIHPAIEARRPGTAERIAEEHLGHETALDELRAGVRAVRRARGPVRQAVADRLYRTLALFVAHNFEHMDVEEDVHNSALWEAYSDAELGALHDRLVAAIEPAQMMAYLRWMIPSVSHAERVGMLSGMRIGAPEGVFEAVLDLAMDVLPQPGWAKLARALGVPPVPGLVRC